MTTIVRRDPFSIGSMRGMMERLFDDLPSSPRLVGDVEAGTLAVDVSREDDQIRVRASLPGFRKEDIEVQLNDGVLSIEATQHEEHEERNERYYQRERRTGSVSRRIALPNTVTDGDVQAELKDGVLTVEIGIPEREKPKRIEISD